MAPTSELPVASQPIEVDCGLELTVRQLSEVQRQLQSALDGAVVTLKLDRIERVDALGVQLLFSFVQTRRAEGRPVHLAGASAQWRAACAAINVQVADVTGL